ncbi:hypothetical protein HOY80DRAFT_958385 [Tuber brumale]|nr:hypothetical protein HOY80DRAFT_958385 [Tuber brumale]
MLGGGSFGYCAVFGLWVIAKVWTLRTGLVGFKGIYLFGDPGAEDSCSVGPVLKCPSTVSCLGNQWVVGSVS